MKNKKNILIDSPEADYKSNSKLLDKLDKIAKKQGKKENENNGKPC